MEELGYARILEFRLPRRNHRDPATNAPDGTASRPPSREPKVISIELNPESSRHGNFLIVFPASSTIFQSHMRVIARRTLRDFHDQHADSKAALEAWYHEAAAAIWKAPQEIKTRYPSADILPGNRVVFNIKGNTYRLIVKIHYNTGIVFIRFIGTHAEYDKIDATGI